MKTFDWNLAQAFLATAEEGSLSAAARRLGLTQPTLGRQVSALEEALGVLLFDRVGRSLSLTPAGEALLDDVRAMGAAADKVLVAATGRAEAVAGDVCISATSAVAAYSLPDILARLAEEAPDIRVEIIASNALSDLRRREADIAIRHVRPEHPELIARLIGESRAAVFASRPFIERYGRPADKGAMQGLPFLAFGAVDQTVRELTSRGYGVAEEDMRYIAEDAVVGWALMRRGLCAGLMSYDIAGRMPDVEALLPEEPPILFPVWLTTHRELQMSRRIRLVFDILAEELKKGL